VPGSAPLDFDRALFFPLSPIGTGGLGRHALEVQQHLVGLGVAVHVGPSWDLQPYEPARDPWRWLGSNSAPALDHYDRWCAATYLPSSDADAVLAFPGAALEVFTAAPRGVKKVLVTSSFHAPTYRRWTAAARRHAPIERSWMTPGMARKMEREANLADVIISNSKLTTDTYVQAGHSPDRFAHIPLTAADMDTPAEHDPPVDILYLGALSVDKGVVDLIRTFSEIKDPAATLRLMGGPRSPGMNAYLRRTTKRDPRVQFGPGNPATQMPSARLLVHPSHADSFSYAVAEGVAAGLPVITTDRVGASDLIRDGLAHPASRIVSAGDRSQLRDAIRSILGTS
jgi:glycosyltransferase involved in cell wall biosynthesis